LGGQSFFLSVLGMPFPFNHYHEQHQKALQVLNNEIDPGKIQMRFQKQK